MIFDKKKHPYDTDSTNKNSTLMLKMVTSYSVFLLVILFLFFLMYRSTINNACGSYDRQRETTLISNVKLFESDLHIMEVYCRQLLQNDSFRKIMNTPYRLDSFLNLGNSVSQTLATDVYAESLLPIKETYCYFPLSDYVLNPNYFISQQRFYYWIQKYPGDLEELWRTYFAEEAYHNRFLPLNDFTPNYSRNYYMYIIDLGDLYYMDAHAQVCFIIEQQELAALFGGFPDDESSFLLVKNEGGAPILTLNNGEAFDEEAILSLDYTDTFASYRVTGANVTVGRYVSETTGYTYYYSFPSFESTTNIWGQQFIFALTFLLTFLTGGILILYLSRRNVRPIIRLGQELHQAVEAQNYLQEVVDSQRPIICTSYVRQLMKGSVTSEEEASYIRDYLELKDASYYNVLYVVIYNNFSDSSETLAGGLSSPEELRQAVANALMNFFGTPLYYFSPTDRTYALLLHCSADEEKNLIMKINNIILRLHDYMLDTYDIWLFAGMGHNTDSLMNVWEAYQQATEAVSYTTKNYIFFPYEFIKKKSNMFYYPTEISTKMIHFITTGNTAQVLELFNLIHQENIEERSLPVNLLKYLLSDIRNTLLKARFALPSDTDPEAVKLLDERFNEHLSFKLCEDLALTLCKLFIAESDDSSLVSTIEKYIVKNYKDPSLGLNKISDEFQISESYFSHMFKEKTGVNFSTYLENIRMNEAARLIQNTDVSLNELYIEVGYNNANTFRRAFKKVFGVTPSSMREKTAK